MDHSTPRKKRKVSESIPSIKKAHKEAKNSGAHKLRELYSAAKSLSDLDDSFSEPTQHQPVCDSALYSEFMESSPERVHNDFGSYPSSSSDSSIQLVSTSSGDSWTESSGSSNDLRSSSTSNSSRSNFWKMAQATANKRTKKAKKGESVDDFFDTKKDYLPFEEEKTEWADDTYLKQIVCCCFFRWK